MTAVRVEPRDRVLVITLDRPEQRNAIDGALARELRDAVRQLDEDPSLTVGVVTGAGPVFCAGMDLKAFGRGEDISPFLELVRNGCQKPLVAAIEGSALGGGLELALACDLLVVAEDVRLGLTETRLGLFAAGGGLLRLPARVGETRALEMTLTGEPIGAAAASACGLVSRVTTAGGALEGALELAGAIAANAPLAVVASKQLIRLGQQVSEAEYWAGQKEHYKRVFRSADAVEGAKAFAEKRPPVWTGR